MENNIVKLPDAYNKNISSNLYMLLSLAYLVSSGLQTDLNNIWDSRDINTAYGATLDNYGEMLGVQRNGATDEQYRTNLLNKISQNVSGSDTDSVINGIALMLNTDPKNLSIIEYDMTVKVVGMTIDMVEASGYSEVEINAMIENILPIGVGLERSVYGGTLLISGTSPTAILADYPQLFPAWYLSQREYVLHGNDVGLNGAGTVPDAFLQVGAGNAPTETEPWYENIGTDGMATSGTYDGGTLGILS